MNIDNKEGILRIKKRQVPGTRFSALSHDDAWHGSYGNFILLVLRGGG